MNATDAVNGRQIMRFSKTDNYDTGSTAGYAFTNGTNALNEVNVKKGRLDIAMHSGMKGDTLVMEGGTFSAIGQTSDIGAVTFDYMSFSGGKIFADISEIENDTIAITNQLTKVGDTSKLGIEIAVSASDLQIWISESGNEIFSVSLLSFATTGSNVAKDDIYLILQDGVYGNISFKESGGNTMVLANLSTVPEPATIAAILAVFALALAFYRKKN